MATDNTSCVACSAPLLSRAPALELDNLSVELPDVVVGTCSRCDGLHVEAETVEQVALFVGLRSPMLEDAAHESLRYFDVTWFENGQGRRSHGWMERQSRRVVQFG